MNLLICDTTRTGKSAALVKITEELIKAEYHVMYVNPKGNPELLGNDINEVSFSSNALIDFRTKITEDIKPITQDNILVTYPLLKDAQKAHAIYYSSIELFLSFKSNRKKALIIDDAFVFESDYGLIDTNTLTSENNLAHCIISTQTADTANEFIHCTPATVTEFWEL